MNDGSAPPRPPLLAIRSAATLAFAIPGLELDVLHHGEVVLRVARRGHEGSLAPCAFRAAVGQATAHVMAGGTAHLLGLGPETGNEADITVRHVMPFTGSATSLGMITARIGDRVVKAFTTPLSSREVVATLRSVVTHPSLPDDIVLNASADPLTAVTLVSCESPTSTMSRFGPHVDALMESLQIHLAVDEITSALSAD